MLSMGQAKVHSPYKPPQSVIDGMQKGIKQGRDDSYKHISLPM